MAARLPYHCNAGDIVGLLSLTTRKSGGLSTIAPSVTIYNEMYGRLTSTKGARHSLIINPKLS